MNLRENDENQDELIIAQLRQAKLSDPVDPKFAATLRADLSLRMKPEETKKSLTYNFMNKFNFALISAVAAAAIALFVFTGSNPMLLPGKQEIARAGEAAFGSLAHVTVSSSRGQGGGSGGAELALPASADRAVGSGGGADIGILPYPSPINYQFAYEGGEFSIDEDKMEVYRRLKGFGTQVDFNSFISRFAVELFNPRKFGSSKLEYFRVAEDRDFGYGLNIDLREGTVNISENWERWQAVAHHTSLRLDQIPPDERIIASANAFLDEYGISRDNYGEPYVQNYWRGEYERLPAADRASYYIPDIVGVVYPLKIAGAEIYDEGGNKNGMTVTYNIRAGRVSSVFELTSQRYESSLYDVEKDPERIKQIAEQGGFRSWYPSGDPSAKTETVRLGTPSQGLVRLWHDLGGKAQDIYVPSLIFPVISAPEGFYGRNVIVPLVKDVLNSQSDQPRILPVAEPKG